MSSTVPPAVERPPYPDYWLMPPPERALSTAVGTNRINWDLRYDDPPGYNPDINNQMNSSPGSVTPAPHGPLALPGTYTLKLIVDGATYTQTLVVHNDPRVGESPAVMTALRAQNKLRCSRYQGMKDAAAGNDEVAAVRAQVAALASAALPPDVAIAATALDAKLATFGGATGVAAAAAAAVAAVAEAAAAARRRAACTSFTALNGTFNTARRAECTTASTWRRPRRRSTRGRADCKNYNTTVAAWKADARRGSRQLQRPADEGRQAADQDHADRR